MVFGAAVGGPGPTSLAYRRTLKHLSPWRRAASSSSTHSTDRSISLQDPCRSSIHSATWTIPGRPSQALSHYSTARDAESADLFPDFDSRSSPQHPLPSSKPARPRPKPSWKKKPSSSTDSSNAGVQTAQHALSSKLSTNHAPGPSVSTSPQVTPSELSAKTPSTSPDRVVSHSPGSRVKGPSTDRILHQEVTPASIAPAKKPSARRAKGKSVSTPAVPGPTASSSTQVELNSAADSTDRSSAFNTVITATLPSPSLVVPPTTPLPSRPDRPFGPKPYHPSRRFGKRPRPRIPVARPGTPRAPRIWTTKSPALISRQSVAKKKSVSAIHPMVRLKRLTRAMSPSRLSINKWSPAQLDQVIDAFWQTWTTPESANITVFTWHRISLAIRTACSTKEGTRAIMEQVIHNSHRYVLLRDMAIEAAARDMWDGLFQLAVAFLAEKNPEEVGHIWQRYQRRIFEVQGKDPANLHSWDRETRLKARAVGEGIRPLNRAFVAAMTAQELMNADDVRRLASDLRGKRGEFNLQWTEDSIKNALQAFPNSSELYSRFETNWEDVQRAGQFEHAKAATNSIQNLAVSKPRAVLDLYQWILEKASGPDPLLVPVPWDETMVSLEAEGGSTRFALPRRVWTALTRAFITNGQFAHLTKLWTRDLPALQIHPPPQVVGDIILKLQTYNRVPERPLNLVNECQKAMTVFRQFHTQRRDGSMLGDDSVRAAALTDMPPAALDDYIARMTMARGRDCGPAVRQELLMQLVFYGKYEQALEVLAWPAPGAVFGPTYAAENLPEPTYWTSFFRAVAKKRDRDPASADRVLQAAMSLAPSPEVRSIHLESAIASHHILMGRDIELCLAPVLKKLNDPVSKRGSAEWMKAMSIILTQQTGKSSRVNEHLADAAFRLIEHFIRHKPATFTEQAASDLIANYVLRMCTAQQMASSKQRMEYILRAVALAKTSFRISGRQFLWILAIKEILARNDGESQQEAMQLWRAFTHAIGRGIKMAALYNDLPLSEPQCRKFVRSVVTSTFKRYGTKFGRSQFWEDARTRSILKAAGLLNASAVKGPTKTLADKAGGTGTLDPEDLLTSAEDEFTIGMDADLLPDATDEPADVFGELRDDDPKVDTKAKASMDPTVSSAPLVAPVLSGVGLASVPKTARLRP